MHLENHRMTKRLANYSLQSLSMNSFRFVSDDTGISRRTLQNLLNEWMQRKRPTWDTDGVYIFLLTDKKEKFVILDSKFNAIKITNNIFDIINIINQFKSKKVVIPFDEKLVISLNVNTDTNVIIDYFEFKDFIERQVWKCYEKQRNHTLRKDKKRDIEPEIKTSIKDEHDLFFKEFYTLSAEEQTRFNKILKENSLYSLYYNIKDKLISKLRVSLTKIQKTIHLELSYTTLLNSMQNEIHPFLLPIPDKRINELFGSIDKLLELGVRIEELHFLKDYRNQYAEEYKRFHKILSPSQFILRWNSDKKYE